MTCIEKLRELHPEWSEWEIANIVWLACPDMFPGIERKERIDANRCGTNGGCSQCWNGEVEEQKPIVSEPLDHLFPLREVHFDDLEEAAIREMSHKLGQPREDIVRMAVREMWSRFRE